MDMNSEDNLTRLLEDANEEKHAHEKPDGNPSTEIKLINLMEAFLVILSFSFGLAVLVTPFTIRQLGLLPWLLLLVVIIATQTYCAYLLNICTIEMCNMHTSYENTVNASIRDPYQLVAYISGGEKLRKFSVIIMYVADISSHVSLLLLSASILSESISISSLSSANNVRIWTSILSFITMPFSLLGTISDMMAPAIIALISVLISLVGVIINCILKDYLQLKSDGIKHDRADQLFFIPIGTLIFLSSGPSLLISNITVLSATPGKLIRSIAASNICTFSAMMIAGLVPFYVFEDSISPSILTTFYNMIRNNANVAVFETVTAVIQFSMLIHLTLVSFTIPNPIFLHLEEVFAAPQQLSWKRVVLRTSYMLTVLSICLAIPEFQFAVTITGGIPISILTMFLPVFMYSKMFEMTVYKKTMLYIFLIAGFLFMLGNLVVSITDLIDY